MTPEGSVSDAKSGMSGAGAMRDDMESLKQDLAQLKETLRLLAADAAGVAKSRASQLKDRAGEAYGEVKERVHNAASYAKEHGREAVDMFENQVEEHPLASVGIAFGVGVLLGALVARR